jgi:hypothetical protein
MEHSFHPFLPSDTSHVREKEVPTNICHIRFSTSGLLPADFRDRGRRFLKQVNCQGGIAKELLSIADCAGTDFLGDGQYGRIDRSSQEVDRIQ